MARRRSCFPKQNEEEKQKMKLSRNRYSDTASIRVSMVWLFLCQALSRVLTPLPGFFRN